MILLAETPVKYRDGTVKTLDELGGEAKELAPDTPVVNGSTSKPLDEFIQDQIVLSPDTVVVDGEDTTSLEEFIEETIPIPVIPAPFKLLGSYNGTGGNYIEVPVSEISDIDIFIICSKNNSKILYPTIIVPKSFLNEECISELMLNNNAYVTSTGLMSAKMYIDSTKLHLDCSGNSIKSMILYGVKVEL